jgi:hypothetical protein
MSDAWVMRVRVGAENGAKWREMVRLLISPPYAWRVPSGIRIDDED